MLGDAPAINLLDHDAFLTGAPTEWFSWLRRNAPVYRHAEPDGPGFWVLSKHADVVFANRSPALFSSDDAYGGPTGLTKADRQRMLDAAKGAKSLPHMDPPEHTKYRKLFDQAFRNRSVAQIEDTVRLIASRLVDDGVEQGSCDFVHAMAARLPTQVISELLGVPEDDRPRLFELAIANFGQHDPEYVKDAAAYTDAREEVARYARALATSRRAEPRDDLMNTLAHAEVDGERMTDEYVGLTFDLFVAAGHETVMTALSVGLDELLAHPEQLKAMQADPVGLAPSATEEFLRWSTPVRYFRRAAVTDVEIAGQMIRSGDSVSLWYSSANRDEDVFADPYAFDITRQPNPHVTFGGGGPHFCLGARLARMEMRVFLEELFSRDLRLERAGEPAALRSIHFNALKHLPIALSNGTGAVV